MQITARVVPIQLKADNYLIRVMWTCYMGLGFNWVKVDKQFGASLNCNENKIIHSLEK